MKTFTYSSPESLESRIAPAGLVTLSFAAGVLSIDGADGADHHVSITKTGFNAFRVDGLATDIGVSGETSKTFRGVLKSVVIAGGAGADTFEVVDLAPLKSFRFEGNGGVDSLSVSNLKTKLTAHVDISLGDEGGSVNLTGSKTLVRGDFNLDLGGGGSATFAAADTMIAGPLTVLGGLEADTLSFTGGKTVVKKSLTFDGGGGNDVFVSTGASFSVRGIVAMDGGAGANDFHFSATTMTVGKPLVAGGVDLKLGDGAGTVTFAGSNHKVLGAVKLDLGTGGGTALLGADVTSIRDQVDVTGGPGNDSLQLDGRVSIGRSLTFVGDAGDDTLSATGGLLSVKGAVSMEGGVGAGVLTLNPTTLAIAALTFIGGSENDSVSIISDGTVSGDADFQMGHDGTGPSSTVIESKAGVANGLKFGQSLSIEMIGATVDALTIANIQVAKKFSAQTGEDVSTVNIARLNVRGDFRLETGSGADVVNIDNVNAADFYVDTQIGADELRIERNAAYAGISKVLGTATILTGIGADQIRIGDASNSADLSVSFVGAMSLDAGNDANMRNDILASNVFGSTSALLSTGGTLTQTEAV